MPPARSFASTLVFASSSLLLAALLGGCASEPHQLARPDGPPAVPLNLHVSRGTASGTLASRIPPAAVLPASVRGSLFFPITPQLGHLTLRCRTGDTVQLIEFDLTPFASIYHHRPTS